jgi:hypothetical protein
VSWKRWIGIAGVLVCALSASANPEGARRLTFDVFLDERPIGVQRFGLETTPNGLRVETEAAFELTVLRITAFAYEHRNVELWRDGCLHSIDSSTNSNGKPYRVKGSAVGDVFLVSNGAGERRLAECVGTFSYWDKQGLLQRSKLLNSQTGEYVNVTARALGPGRLKLGDRELPVERYELRGRDLEIQLAYSAETGEWVALDSEVAGGRTLRYRRSAEELRELGRAAAAGMR